MGREYKHSMTLVKLLLVYKTVLVYTIVMMPGEYVRVKCMSFDLVPCVVSVKMNYTYWPTTQVTYTCKKLIVRW